ncbi:MULTISPECIES: DUF680 domain-containing protein [unclassified Mesorhizobium]|uniref:DUF680 domain-containing protein n=2 Tax=Mesorhizobium TaxID=68287 RepID=UPI000FCAE6D5|nr:MULTISPECIES: DUF680 domain-containing protein [unclassified Mesorhizobium]RVA28835.1 DUF680 domain-containing protein [Mesorhizobium sp. M7A.F.Ca.US.001.01.1.1]RUX71049.1 DUF680 domain-containing protein [Mesorhizobium sp. M7A.F.Ca.US.005.03.1.1]RUY16554.1 DUF680 domain-containing protein [Mesorhizobium sp. M7A.F.Ca.US.005.03.2.1]RUY94782.1 DUF680 domain-containing protein [Mesorhizobium sp. M7A.F.Ca.CA.001.12.2.1]RUZ17025.1 DUF680 domain-containing protein [Mesorhizobium sp. M7A.F.Ca.US.0
MTKLALSVAAMLLASSAVFAGSDHGANNSNQPATSVDTNATASIPSTPRQDSVDSKVTTGPSQGSVQDIINRHNNDGLWGR